MAAHGGPAFEKGERLQLQFLQLVFRDDQARSGRVVLLRGVARRDGAVLHDGLELRERLHAGIGAHAFVAREDAADRPSSAAR